MTLQGLLLLDLACIAVLLMLGDMVRRRALHLGCAAYLALPAALVMLGINYPGVTRVLLAPLNALFPGAGVLALFVAYFFTALLVLGVQLCHVQSRQQILARHLAVQRALIEAPSEPSLSSTRRP